MVTDTHNSREFEMNADKPPLKKLWLKSIILVRNSDSYSIKKKTIHIYYASTLITFFVLFILSVFYFLTQCQWICHLPIAWRWWWWWSRLMGGKLVNYICWTATSMYVVHHIKWKYICSVWSSHAGFCRWWGNVEMLKCCVGFVAADNIRIFRKISKPCLRLKNTAYYSFGTKFNFKIQNNHMQF